MGRAFFILKNDQAILKPNRLLTAALAALLLTAGGLRASAQQVVTVETKWNEKTVSMTTTSVTSAILDVMGFGAAGGGLLGNTYVQNGTDGTTAGTTSTIVSTTPINGVLFDYSFYAQGSTGTLKIAQTIKMPVPLGVGIRNGNGVLTSTSTFSKPYPVSYIFTVPVISTSSAIIEPSGTVVTASMRAQVQNPVFLLSNLSTSATYTLTLNYGVPYQQ